MRKVIWIAGGGIILILVAFGMGMCASVFSVRDVGFSSAVVGTAKIDGAIMTADDTVEKLEKLRRDSSVKAVVLRIDSPGGAVAASQEIFEGVKRLNSEKPVVVSMGDVAASGGYYIACGAKKILANEGTITGSIGVRMEHMNLKDLLSWAKIGHETLKSGEYKDLGSFDRPITPAEREILEGVLTDMHKQFKEAVVSTRNLTAEKVEEIADGRIFTGRQALDIGLIDGIGGMTDAVRLAGELAGIKGEPKIKKFEPDKPWWVDPLLRGTESILQRATRPSAMYLIP